MSEMMLRSFFLFLSLSFQNMEIKPDTEKDKESRKCLWMNRNRKRQIKLQQEVKKSRSIPAWKQ